MCDTSLAKLAQTTLHVLDVELAKGRQTTTGSLLSIKPAPRAASRTVSASTGGTKASLPPSPAPDDRPTPPPPRLDVEQHRVSDKSSAPSARTRQQAAAPLPTVDPPKKIAPVDADARMFACLRRRSSSRDRKRLSSELQRLQAAGEIREHRVYEKCRLVQVVGPENRVRRWFHSNPAVAEVVRDAVLSPTPETDGGAATVRRALDRTRRCLAIVGDGRAVEAEDAERIRSAWCDLVDGTQTGPLGPRLALPAGKRKKSRRAGSKRKSYLLARVWSAAGPQPPSSSLGTVASALEWAALAEHRPDVLLLLGVRADEAADSTFLRHIVRALHDEDLTVVFGPAA